MLVIAIVVITLVIVAAALLLVAATKPATFRVQRSASIHATREKIYPFIEDFHNWGYWSPYEKLDPTMKKTYTGAISGKGAVYEWAGNSKAGTGRMEITSTSAPSKVTIKLDFLKPFEGHNTSEFALDGEGDSTNVTWAMYGPNSYAAKLMSIFMTMDRLLGKEFENGLANLKSAAEK